MQQSWAVAAETAWFSSKKNTSYLVLERKIFAEIEIVIDFRARLTHSESGAASVCCGPGTYAIGIKPLHHLTEHACQPSKANVIISNLKVMKQGVYKDGMI